jgi:hypothetical protein
MILPSEFCVHSVSEILNSDLHVHTDINNSVFDYLYFIFIFALYLTGIDCRNSRRSIQLY